MADFSKYAEEALVPTQRGRTFAQGLTFGFADEIEAAIRSLGGREYSELVKEVRSAVAEYQADRPMEALAAEIGGAALPALIGSLFTGGAAGAATAARIATKFPTIAKVAGVTAPVGFGQAVGYGVAQGALTGAGKGETNEQRALGAMMGAPVGAIAGGATYAIAEPVKNALVGVVDAARRRLGGRGAKVVETELQRLASESGLSIDEIVEGVASGRIMAENKTLLDAVRSYRATGGKASSQLKETFERRPEAKRQGAMSSIQSQLSQVDDPNVLRSMKASDTEAKALERASYEQFKTMEAPAMVFQDLADSLVRSPAAAKEVEEALLARTGRSPFYSVDDAGSVSFERPPTLEEAEAIRRALAGTAEARYKSGQGVAGEAISDLEGGLRETLDIASPELASVRSQASAVRTARSAFKDGQSAFSKSADAIEVEFAEIMQKGPEAVKAYRAGIMQALRNKMSGATRKSFMNTLLDPERKEGRILSLVLPEDSLPKIMANIEGAAASQTAATKILGGSDTAITTAQIARQGGDVGIGEVAETIMSPNPINILRLLGKVVKKSAPNLSDKERERIVQILISESPSIVQNALKDESGLAVLQQAVDRISGAARGGLLRSAPIISAGEANEQFGAK